MTRDGTIWSCPTQCLITCLVKALAMSLCYAYLVQEYRNNHALVQVLRSLTLFRCLSKTKPFTTLTENALNPYICFELTVAEAHHPRIMTVKIKLHHDDGDPGVWGSQRVMRLSYLCDVSATIHSQRGRCCENKHSVARWLSWRVRFLKEITSYLDELIRSNVDIVCQW